MPQQLRAWFGVALVGLALALLAAHAAHYLPFISDDALISLRYARRLLAGGGLTWTDGERVEGYSNLLWILGVAFVGLFRVDVITASRALGLLGMGVIAVAVAFTAMRRDAGRATWIPLALALFFISAAAPVAVWAIGGLEQPLYGALLAVGCAAMDRVLADRSRAATVTLSLSLGLACLTRPDGPIFAAAAATSLLVARGFRRTAVIDVVKVLAGPVVLVLAQLAFRVWYYGEMVPNTALVKLTPSAVHAAAGWRYLTNGIRSLQPLSGLAIASLVVMLFDRRRRAWAGYLLLTAVVWSAYVVVIGGDIFPAYRHLIPLIVVFAFALADGPVVLLSRVSGYRVACAVAAVAAVAVSVPYARTQASDRQAQRAMRERWEWQGRDLALMLRAAFGRQNPLMAVTAAGCLPYWSEFRSLDMLGLNDYYIPRHPPPNLGEGALGHELGDGPYVLSRSPDLIVFNVGTEPAYRSGEQLNALPEFHRRYAPVVVRPGGSEDSYLIYADKYSAAIGLRRSGSAITVPGFFFQGGGAAAYLDPMNRLVMPLTAAAPLTAAIDLDEPHDWRVEVDATNSATVAATAVRTGRTVTITLRATGADPVDVRGVVLRSLW